jgi:hypothetical protein
MHASPSLLRGDACVALRSLECHDCLAYGWINSNVQPQVKPVSHTYRVHGLTLRCQFPLPELARREVACPEVTDISVRAGSLPVTDKATPTSIPYLHLLDNAALFTFEDTARYCVRDGSDVVVDAKANADPALLRLHIFASIMGMICHQRGLLVLHASAVAFGNTAVAFTGPPGAGKSTMAAHCLAAGGRLVADDVLVLSFDEKGGVLAHPGMPNVKLWRDALTSLGRDTDGLRPDWFRAEKFHLPSDDVQTSIPLTRLYVLGTDATAGDGEYAPLRGQVAASVLIANTYRVEYLDAANRRNAHFRDCIRLASEIDVVWLRREAGAARLPATAAAIMQRLRQTSERAHA